MAQKTKTRTIEQAHYNSIKEEKELLNVATAEKLLNGIDVIEPIYYYNRLLVEHFRCNKSKAEFAKSLGLYSVQIKSTNSEETPFWKIDLDKINEKERGEYNQWLCLQNGIHCHVYRPGAQKANSPIIVKSDEFYLSNLTPNHTYTVRSRLYNLSTGKYIDEEIDDVKVKSWTFTAKSSVQKVEGAHKKAGKLVLGKLDHDLTGKLTETTNFDVHISLFLKNDDKQRDLLPIYFAPDYSVMPRNIDPRNELIDNAVDTNIIKPENSVKIKEIDKSESKDYYKPLRLFENVHWQVYRPNPTKIIVETDELCLSNLTPGHTYTVMSRLYNLSTGKYVDEEYSEIEIKSWTFTAKSSVQKVEGAHKKSGKLVLGKLDYDLTDKLTETTSFDVRISLFSVDDNKKCLLPISFFSDFSLLFRNIEHLSDKAADASVIETGVQIRKIDDQEIPFNEIDLEKINGEEREEYNQWLCLKNNVHCYVKTDSQMIVRTEFYLTGITPGLMYTVECGLYNPSTGKYYNKERNDIDIKSWTFVAKSSVQKVEGAHKEAGILVLGELDFDITDKFTKTSDFEVHISLVLENDDRRCSLPIVCDSSVTEAIKKSDLEDLISFKDGIKDEKEKYANGYVKSALKRRDGPRGISETGLTRYKIYMCAFAFNLDYDEVLDLMWRCLGEQDFNYKNPYEVIFVYCITNHEGNLCQRYIDLKNEYKRRLKERNGNEIKYISQKGKPTQKAKSDYKKIEKVQSDNALINFLLTLPETKSNSAKREFKKIYNEIFNSKQLKGDLKAHNDKSKIRIEDFEKGIKLDHRNIRKTLNNNFMVQSIFGTYEKGQNKKPYDATIAKLGMFNSKELEEMLDLESDRTVKKADLLIMIFFKYVYLWGKNTPFTDFDYRCKVFKDRDLIKRTTLLKFIYEDFSSKANKILSDAGFSRVYLPNALERYIVYSLCSDEPLSTFQTFFKE